MIFSDGWPSLEGISYPILPVFLASLLIVACGACSDTPAEPAGETGRITVPEGFTIERVAGPDLVDFPTFATFDNRGRLFVIESTQSNTMTTEAMLEHPHHRIKVLEDTDGDGMYDKSTVFADSLTFPEGGNWYHGSFYVAAAPDLMRFTDTDGDNVADEKEVILTGWTLNVNGAVLSGPFIGPDGWFYLADAHRGYKIKTKEGEVLQGKGSRIWRCRPDGTGLEWISGGGFDNSIEIAFTPAGETIGTMTYFTNPKAGQRDALMHWVYGGIYPKLRPVSERDNVIRTGGLMPVMTKRARIAHSGLYRYDHPHFGPAYQGNLFSADFNTGRVTRYILSRDGATFKTEEKTFLSSTDPHFHPTDVLAAPDGSLLVVDTGSWFVKGCPLSQVDQQPDQGGIYRIRKTGGKTIADPLGKRLNIPSLSPEALVDYLGDPRPFVRDRVVEELVKAGAASVPPLTEVLGRSESADVRTAVVFALFRIGTPEAAEAVRAALDDPVMQVRLAAARSVGMAEDPEAVDRLVEMVREDAPAVQRQAATALGQIGEQRATEALLAAAADPEDRFVEHAIIYSLITLEAPQPLIQALGHSSDPEVRKAALIALDQMEGSHLVPQQLVSFLASENPELRSTGVWVAVHHPEWSKVVLSFLSERLRDQGLPEEEEQSVADVVVSFCEDEGVQRLVTQFLQDTTAPSGRKALLLGAMGRCPVEELPAGWVQQIGELLQADTGSVRSRALDLVEARGLTALADDLERIASDQTEEGAFRTNVLGALTRIRPQLSQTQFAFLLGELQPEEDAPLRQAAAQVLAQADLNSEQLIRLAQEKVARADPFILTTLVNAFEGSSNAQVGEVLIEALKGTPERLGSLSEQNVEDLFAHYPESVQHSARPLLAALREQHKSRLARLQELQSQLAKGNVGEGRKIFFGKAICSTCHAVAGNGGTLGPDLTNIGEIRSRHNLLEAILYPSVSFAREHETYQVETRSNTYTGIIAEQTAVVMVLKTGPETQVRIPREEVVSMTPTPVSMMPQGLDKALTTDELSDLMAFLEALPGAARWPEESPQASE